MRYRKNGWYIMIIKQNKWNTIFYILLVALFLALFVFVGFFCDDFVIENDLKIRGVPVFSLILRILSVVCSIVMAAVEVYFVSQLFSKKPLIEICDEYFYDNSSALSLGRIEWEDMKSAYLGSDFLNIKLKDPDKYLKRANKIQLLLIRSNQRMGYGDICISAQRFQKRQEEFLEAFNAKIKIAK